MTQSRPGSNGNEGVFHITQSSSITRASSLDCLVTYSGHSLGESYPSTEMQSTYSASPAGWVKFSTSEWLLETKRNTQEMSKTKCAKQYPASLYEKLKEYLYNWVCEYIGCQPRLIRTKSLQLSIDTSKHNPSFTIQQGDEQDSWIRKKLALYHNSHCTKIT